MDTVFGGKFHKAEACGSASCGVENPSQYATGHRTDKMYRIICIFVVCLTATKAADFTDCGSQLGKFTSISVSNCKDTDVECILNKGTNATIQIAFNAEEDIKAVKAVAHGLLAGIPIPFPMPNADACANPDTGITCPLSKGGSFTYKKTFAVLQQYPKVKVEVKWELQNEEGKDIVCIMIPARIQ